MVVGARVRVGVGVGVGVRLGLRVRRGSCWKKGNAMTKICAWQRHDIAGNAELNSNYRECLAVSRPVKNADPI